MKNITELVGIEYPIFQGAMAKISTHQLVIAVSEAGGLGTIASGGMTTKKLREEIKAVKAGTNKPFAVNIVLLMDNCDELVDVVIEEDVKIVTTSAGTPKRFMSKLKEAGIIVIPVVPNVAIAKKMQDLGADAVITEGTEAGGHIGEVSTLPLVASAVKALDIPVIAAGGISDARSITAVFALGAKGAQMGTAYLVTEECPISMAYKEKVLASDETDTVVTGRKFGAPVRAISNEMTGIYRKMEDGDVDRQELEKLTLGSLDRAVIEGDMVTGSVMAGQIAGNLDKIQTVQAFHDTVITELKELEITVLN